MITGLTLKNSIISGANNLSNRRAKVDELNVFPVPDGDTGTNMGMTIGAARTELLNLPDDCTVEKAAQVTEFFHQCDTIISYFSRKIYDKMN